MAYNYNPRQKAQVGKPPTQVTRATGYHIVKRRKAEREVEKQLTGKTGELTPEQYRQVHGYYPKAPEPEPEPTPSKVPEASKPEPVSPPKVDYTKQQVEEFTSPYSRRPLTSEQIQGQEQLQASRLGLPASSIYDPRVRTVSATIGRKIYEQREKKARARLEEQAPKYVPRAERFREEQEVLKQETAGFLAAIKHEEKEDKITITQPLSPAQVSKMESIQVEQARLDKEYEELQPFFKESQQYKQQFTRFGLVQQQRAKQAEQMYTRLDKLKTKYETTKTYERDYPARKAAYESQLKHYAAFTGQKIKDKPITGIQKVDTTIRKGIVVASVPFKKVEDINRAFGTTEMGQHFSKAYDVSFGRTVEFVETASFIASRKHKIRQQRMVEFRQRFPDDTFLAKYADVSMAYQEKGQAGLRKATYAFSGFGEKLKYEPVKLTVTAGVGVVVGAVAGTAIGGGSALTAAGKPVAGTAISGITKGALATGGIVYGATTGVEIASKKTEEERWRFIGGEVAELTALSVGAPIGASMVKGVGGKTSSDVIMKQVSKQPIKYTTRTVMEPGWKQKFDVKGDVVIQRQKFYEDLMTPKVRKFTQEKVSELTPEAFTEAQYSLLSPERGRIIGTSFEGYKSSFVAYPSGKQYTLTKVPYGKEMYEVRSITQAGGRTKIKVTQVSKKKPRLMGEYEETIKPVDVPVGEELPLVSKLGEIYSVNKPIGEAMKVVQTAKQRDFIAEVRKGQFVAKSPEIPLPSKRQLKLTLFRETEAKLMATTQPGLEAQEKFYRYELTPKGEYKPVLRELEIPNIEYEFVYGAIPAKKVEVSVVPETRTFKIKSPPVPLVKQQIDVKEFGILEFGPRRKVKIKKLKQPEEVELSPIAPEQYGQVWQKTRPEWLVPEMVKAKRKEYISKQRRAEGFKQEAELVYLEQEFIRGFQEVKPGLKTQQIQVQWKEAMQKMRSIKVTEPAVKVRTKIATQTLWTEQVSQQLQKQVQQQQQRQQNILSIEPFQIMQQQQREIQIQQQRQQQIQQQDQKLIEQQLQKQVQQQVQQQIQQQYITEIRLDFGFGFTPPPPPLIPGFPNIGGGLRWGYKQKKRVRQPKAYVPELYSTLLGVYAEPKMAAVKTGLGQRPLVKLKKKKRKGVI